jgi:hypothetical protein
VSEAHVPVSTGSVGQEDCVRGIGGKLLLEERRALLEGGQRSREVALLGVRHAEPHIQHAQIAVILAIQRILLL